MFLFTPQNINQINKIKHSDFIPPHKMEKLDRLDDDDFLFKKFDINSLMNTPPPKNASLTTNFELNYLQSLPQLPEKVEYYDNIKRVFKDVCMENGIEYPKNLVKSLIKESKPIITKLKYHYNRPRPYVLAKQYNINLDVVDMDSTDSPSYPSGHTIQAWLVGYVLSTKNNIGNDSFYRAANNISWSRMIGRVHFPSDVKFGKYIGKRLFKHIIHKI